MGVLGQRVTTTTAGEVLLIAGAPTIISTLFVCTNGVAGPPTFDISIVPSGQTYAAANDLHRLYNTATLSTTTSTVAITAGITLSEGDRIVVLSSVAGVTFTAFGVVTA